MRNNHTLALAFAIVLVTMVSAMACSGDVKPYTEPSLQTTAGKLSADEVESIKLVTGWAVEAMNTNDEDGYPLIGGTFKIETESCFFDSTRHIGGCVIIYPNLTDTDLVRRSEHWAGPASAPGLRRLRQFLEQKGACHPYGVATYVWAAGPLCTRATGATGRTSINPVPTDGGR